MPELIVPPSPDQSNYDMLDNRAKIAVMEMADWLEQNDLPPIEWDALSDVEKDGWRCAVRAAIG